MFDTPLALYSSRRFLKKLFLTLLISLGIGLLLILLMLTGIGGNPIEQGAIQINGPEQADPGQMSAMAGIMQSFMGRVQLFPLLTFPLCFGQIGLLMAMAFEAYYVIFSLAVGMAKTRRQFAATVLPCYILFWLLSSLLTLGLAALEMWIRMQLIGASLPLQEAARSFLPSLLVHCLFLFILALLVAALSYCFGKYFWITAGVLWIGAPFFHWLPLVQEILDFFRHLSLFRWLSSLPLETLRLVESAGLLLILVAVTLRADPRAKRA